MGRCNPITKTCTRTPWWRSALGVDWIGGSGGGGEEPEWLIVWVMGDSHATKRPSGAYGPTPTAGTVYQWDTSEQELYEISSTDILGGDADNGSVFPQLGINLNASTGKKIVFVTSGTGGSNYSPRTGDTGDWTDADTLWSTCVN